MKKSPSKKGKETGGAETDAALRGPATVSQCALNAAKKSGRLCVPTVKKGP